MPAKAKELGAVLIMEPIRIVNAGSMFVAIDPVGAANSFWRADQHVGAAVEYARALSGTVQRETWDSRSGRRFVTTDPQGPAFCIVAMPDQE